MMPFLLDLGIKSTLLLLLAIGAVMALRRLTPAMRHLIWSLSLGGLLVLPILTYLLPAWNVLPDWRVSVKVSPGVLPSQATGHAERVPQPMPTLQDDRGGIAPPVKETVAARGERGMSWGMWGAMVYVGGVVVALLPLMVSLIALKRLRRRAAMLAADDWMALLDELRRELGIRRSVALLRSAEASMPMTWGLVHPRILLPGDAEKWSPERRRLVLLHELAHIKRRDTRTQIVARVICAFYWPHPLVWLAARNMRNAAELACDDLVLNSQTKPSTYASEILDMASKLCSTKRTGAAAIAMARPSQLEHRLLAILDTSRSRRGLTRVAACVALAVGITMLALLAVCRAEIRMVTEPAADRAKIVSTEDEVEVRNGRKNADSGAATASARAVVIKTFPEADATNVSPAVREIRVTFSKDMSLRGWSWVTIDPKAFPKIDGKIRYLDDKRTCVLPVALEPNHHYALGINSNKHQNFRDAEGQPSVPFVLEFDTGPSDGAAATQAVAERPRVVLTVPEKGAKNVDPAVTEIRVTFSKDMNNGSWSWVTFDPAEFPKITGKIKYLDDKRTCVLPVALEPDHVYRFGINSEKYRNFRDRDGRSAEPFVLEFETR